MGKTPRYPEGDPEQPSLGKNTTAALPERALRRCRAGSGQGRAEVRGCQGWGVGPVGYRADAGSAPGRKVVPGARRGRRHRVPPAVPGEGSRRALGPRSSRLHGRASSLRAPIRLISQRESGSGAVALLPARNSLAVSLPGLSRSAVNVLDFPFLVHTRCFVSVVIRDNTRQCFPAGTLSCASTQGGIVQPRNPRH